MKEKIKKIHYLNGQLCYETKYVNGKEHGWLKGWHENGQIMYEILCINGNRRGLAKGWYLNEKIWHETPYKNNLECGAKINYFY